MHQEHKNVLLIYAKMQTFGVKALSDPVLPEHHIHPLPVATHEQSHLGQGGLADRPRHLRHGYVLKNCEATVIISINTL